MVNDNQQTPITYRRVTMFSTAQTAFNSRFNPLKKSRVSGDIVRRVRRIAEEEALQLFHRQHMSPAQIITYYTGKTQPDAHFTDAVEEIVRFNLDLIESRGFAPF